MSEPEQQDDLCDTPLSVTTEGRAIVLLGPDGVSLALTVEAAERSVERLKDAISAAKSA